MTEISEKVLALATAYLGPAAKTFLQRQTTAHMNGLSFDTLSKANIQELSKWVKVSAALVISTDKANELADKISKLA